MNTLLWDLWSERVVPADVKVCTGYDLYKWFRKQVAKWKGLEKHHDRKQSQQNTKRETEYTRTSSIIEIAQVDMPIFVVNPFCARGATAFHVQLQ